MKNESPWSLSLLNNRFPALHGLRVLAILLVVQLHATDAITHESMGVRPGAVPTNWGALLSFNAWFAMDLFFIMSGFLIGHILIYAFTQSKEHSGTVFKRFYFRRSFRTFPLYYFFLFSFYFIDKVVPVATPVTRLGFTGLTYHELFYLTNYPFEAWHYLAYWSWSLSLEEHFYLLAPLFIYFLMKLQTHRARFIMLGVVWSMAFFVRLLTYLYWTHKDPLLFIPMTHIYAPTHVRFDILIAGIFIAYLDFFFSDQVKAFLSRKWIPLSMVLVSLCGFAVILSPEINPTPLGLIDIKHLDLITYTGRLGIFYFGTLTSICYVLLIIPCLYLENRFTRWLGNINFLRLATLGYGIYLVHMPIVYKVAAFMNHYLPRPQDAFFIHWISVTTIAMILSSLLAYVMHLGIEKPCLFIRDKLIP